MAIISPFRAWRYNPEQVPVQQAVTQPYDKITPAMQERYYQASPYNLVRIILGKRLPEDGNAENVYTRAAAVVPELASDRRFASGSCAFALPLFTDLQAPARVPGTGKQAERRSFIALGRIEIIPPA